MDYDPLDLVTVAITPDTAAEGIAGLVGCVLGASYSAGEQYCLVRLNDRNYWFRSAILVERELVNPR
jgi:hypothetical protein